MSSIGFVCISLNASQMGVWGDQKSSLMHNTIREWARDWILAVSLHSSSIWVQARTQHLTMSTLKRFLFTIQWRLSRARVCPPLLLREPGCKCLSIMKHRCTHPAMNVYMKIMTVWLGCYSKVISIKFIFAFSPIFVSFLFRFRAFDFTLETVQFSGAFWKFVDFPL